MVPQGFTSNVMAITSISMPSDGMSSLVSLVLFVRPCGRDSAADPSPKASVWQYAHLLFVMSYILAAAALTRLVLAHDCPDTPVESLTHLWEERSEEEVGLG